MRSHSPKLLVAARSRRSIWQVLAWCGLLLVVLPLSNLMACMTCVEQAAAKCEHIVLGRAVASPSSDMACQLTVTDVLKGAKMPEAIPVTFFSAADRDAALKSAGTEMLWFLRQKGDTFYMTLPAGGQKLATENLEWFREVCGNYRSLKGGRQVDGLELILVVRAAQHGTDTTAKRLYQSGTAQTEGQPFKFCVFLRNNGERTRELYNFLRDAPYSFIVQGGQGVRKRVTTKDIFPLAFRGKASEPKAHHRISLAPDTMIQLRTFDSAALNPSHGMEIQFEFRNQRAGKDVWVGQLLSNTVRLDVTPTKSVRKK